MGTRPRRLRLRVLSAFLTAIACSSVSSVAAADDAVRLRIDWDGLGAILRQGTPGLLPHESWRSEAPERFGATASEPPPWIGVSPRVSLVARDWGVSQVLWGHLSLTDQLRLIRSSRMVVTRVGFADGRIVPFAQMGVGQWRVDTSLLPSLPSDAQPAGQLGGGFELEVMPHAVVALEGDCTMLYHEGREPMSLAIAHVWGTLLAARARF